MNTLKEVERMLQDARTIEEIAKRVVAYLEAKAQAIRNSSAC